MGNWTITIQGVGTHHNKNLAEDADRMAAKFVEDLKDKGHVVTAASITSGREDVITDGAKYLADKDAIDAAEPVR